jgi:dihydroorotase
LLRSFATCYKTAQEIADGDKNTQIGTNAALAVTGIFLIVPWFFMDLGGAASAEQKAAKARYERLQQMQIDKKCPATPIKSISDTAAMPYLIESCKSHYQTFLAATSPFKAFAISDDGHCVSDPLVMRRALEYIKKFGGVIAQHAQDPRMTIGSQMNEGEISARLGLKGWPAVAEEAIIARDVLLADHVKSRLHICHLTTAGGVEIIRWAKARGIDVTAEVTPHHLLLTDDLASSYDPVYKVNPPLRTESDVHALREALADGTIDIVATDHAPHPTESKECEWQEAAFGMLGLETALSVVQKTMIDTGLMSWSQVADRMSIAPARIGGYEHQGQPIAVGSVANLVVINPTQKWRVDRDLVLSKSSNTPYHGHELPGVITHTFFKGKATFSNGSVTSTGGN